MGIGFNGTTDSLRSGLLAVQWSDPAWTLSLWVRATALGQLANRAVFANRVSPDPGTLADSFQLDVDGTIPGNYRVRTTIFASIPIGPVTTNWVHIVVAKSGPGQVDVYRDGQLFNTGLFPAVTWRRFVSGVNRAGASFFQGEVADIRVYRARTLNAREVETIYSARGTDGIVDALELRWAPRGPEGTASGVVTDLSGNGFTGSPFGAPNNVTDGLRQARRLP